jgi:hypothetical protein
MATEIITGRDMTFTIDSDNYDAQATSATLTLDTTIVTLQTLDGKAYTTVDSQGSFAVEMIADYGAASSLCEALWTAASSAPNTPLLSCYSLQQLAQSGRSMFSQSFRLPVALHPMCKQFHFHSCA